MSTMQPASGPYPTPDVHGGNAWGAAIAVHAADVVVPLLTFAISLAVLLVALLSAFASAATVIPLTCATLLLPLTLLAQRLRRGGDITIPVLLLITTFASGPIGGLGCAYLAMALARRRPTPTRLRAWYEYIAGIVARDRIARLHEDLSSGRLPHEPSAEVPRFRPILHGTSTEEQQRVLGVLGQRYHVDFRPALRDALRNKNSFIRAQAAAVASRLDAEEKKKLWSDVPADGSDAP